MPKSSQTETEYRADENSHHLFFSILFQHLRNHAGVTDFLVWRNQDDLEPIYVCSTGVVASGFSGEEKKRALAKRALSSRRSVVSKGSLQPNEPDAKDAELFLVLDDAHVAQMRIVGHADDPQLDRCVSAAKQIVDSMCNRTLAADSSAATDRTRPSGVELEMGPARDMATADVSADKLFEFFHTINRSLDSKTVAFDVANEVRKATGSDRVSVFGARGRSFTALAASGVSAINHRSKEIRQLQKLVREVVKLRQTFVYPDEESNPISRSLELALSNYLSDQSARSLMVLPVFESRNGGQEDSGMRRTTKRKRRVIGAIALEHIQSKVEVGQLERNERIGRCGADSIRNAIQHRRLFLYPVWNFLGRVYDFLIGRHFKVTTFSVCVVLALSIIAFFWQSQYRLSCRGELRPELSRTIYAEIDGLVSDVFTDTGRFVSKGEKLIQVENRELLIRQQELQGNMSAILERIESIDRFSVGDPRNPGKESANREQIAMERSGLEKQIETIKSQLEVVNRQISMQEISSPIAGEVLTTNLKRELADRPVSRGAELLEIAATEGEWVLDLKLPDKYTGELLKAQESKGDSLSVTFILASEPERSHRGQIKSVELAMQTDESIGQYLQLVVEIDEEPFADAKVGTEVIAYVECGKRSLGFVWTKDVVDFFRRRVAFPFF